MPGGSASWGPCHPAKDLGPGTPTPRTPFCRGPLPLGVLAAHPVCTGHLWALLPADRGDQRQGLRGQGHPASPAHCAGHQGQGESGEDTESPRRAGDDAHGDPQILALAPPPCRWGVPIPVPPRSGGFPGAAGLSPVQVEREQELQGHLCHRHIVRLHGHFADCSHVYLLLELCSRGVSEHGHPKTQRPRAGAVPGPQLAPRSVPSPSPTSCGRGGG